MRREKEEERWRVAREEFSPGWGLSILKQQEQRGRIVSQRRVKSRFGCNSNAPVSELEELSLKEEDEDGTTSSSSTITSSGSFGLERAVSCSSISSVGSSSSSCSDHTSGDCYQAPRSSYKRGLSQRRIRASPDSTPSSFDQPLPQIQTKLPEIHQTDETILDYPVEPKTQAEVRQVEEEEELFSAVKTKDESTVRSLYNAGISLEIVDKHGMTPLIVACLDGSLFEMVRTLINLGANVHAYRSGTHAGFPLHHAAKRGHDHIVKLLLSSGAEALGVNDDGQTALDIARIRAHAPVVRVLEDWISLFKGVLRQITDTAGSQIMRRVWAVVLPSETSRQELVVYHSRKVALPDSVILLGSVTSEVDEPDYVSLDPSLVITDRVTRTRFKFLSHERGDKKQISEFYRACGGVRQEKNKSNVYVSETVEQTRQRRSCDGLFPTNRSSRNVPPVPRSRFDKPSSRKNVIYPEESLQ